jgi:hypothetical protein
MLRPWFLVEQPSESGGASVLVYSSGPEQPDASGVELPTGARGIIALWKSTGPGVVGTSK